MGKPRKYRRITLASSDTYVLPEEFEDVKSLLIEEKEMNDEEDTTVTDEDVYERIRMQNEDDLDNLEWELKQKQAQGQIIGIVDMGMWDGRENNYILFDRNVEDILDTIHRFRGIEDYEIYLDTDENIKMELKHHDGTHYVTFREFKPNITSSQMDDFIGLILTGQVTNHSMGYYTKNIKEYVSGIVG